MNKQALLKPFNYCREKDYNSRCGTFRPSEASMASSVTLQAPGAGLPAFELTWLRPAFRLICALTSQERALQNFKLEAQKILALTRGLSSEEASTRVLIKRIPGIEDNSRFWSVFMVLDHLRIVDGEITEIVSALTQGSGYDIEVRIRDVKPSPEASPEIVQKFLAWVDTDESTVDRLGELGRCARHPHPWFGAMTAHDWHCLAGVHHRVHRRQIERIVSALTY